jgi:hypothetical protein
VFDHVLTLVVAVGTHSGGLSADHSQLHELDLDAHQKKVDLAQNHILKQVKE